MQGARSSMESDPSEWESEPFSLARSGGDDRARDPERSVEVCREVMVQRRDVSLQVNMDEESMEKSKDSKSSSSGEVDPSMLSTATKRGRKWGRARAPKQWGKTRKGRLWKRFRLDAEDGSSSGQGPTRCLRCGRLHRGPCRVGTTACFRCGQEGHFARDCPTAPRRVWSQQRAAGDVAQASVPGRGADTSNAVMPGTLTCSCSDVCVCALVCFPFLLLL
ncbi:hypothetical protein MANES_S032016v8 [Manihot esculenta]|uniref:Uncharacterized protein n=1 Tax=Manihot esculenta TaxID=3983 RepID=A0ACB7FUV2_MANES|nr:hypothetical protein MANES_S032016v8 [Manihot esculenta]